GMNEGLPASNFSMILSSARSIKILKNAREYLTVNSLAKTSDKAVGKPIAGGSDIEGPLDVAAAAEYTGGYKPTRLLVMGSSSFITDAMVNGYTKNGLVYFLVAMNWMSDKTDDLYIAPKVFDKRSIDLSQLQADIAGGVVTGLIPLLILGTGLFVWTRRRHL
ncbi:MAG: transmembrane domain-containing protein, partial [Eubacteriales bacterium]|nr:transmembrane domain-containing protein [Eubacteriales bacterium]